MASSPRAVPVPPPHVKISRNGRPYVDVGELIKSELEKIEQSRRPIVERPQPPASDSNNRGQGPEPDASG